MAKTVGPGDLARRNGGAIASLALLLALGALPIAIVELSIELDLAGHHAQISPATASARVAAVLLAQFLGHFLAGSAAIVGLGVVALAFGSHDGLTGGRIGAVLPVLGRCARALVVHGLVEPVAPSVHACRARRREEPVRGVLEQLRDALVISPAAPPFALAVENLSFENVSIERAEAKRP